MISRSVKLFTLMTVAIFGLTACGGGGEGRDDAAVRAGASLRLAGTMASGQSVHGVQMTLHMPPGVTVKINPANGDVAASVIRFTGSGNPTIGVNYIPASGELIFLVVHPTGFTLGDFLELTLDVTPGTIPVASDFFLTDVSISDPDGNVLADLQPVMTVTIQ